MTDVNPSYPPVSEAVDNQLSKQIDTLNTTTDNGFRELNRKMESMATKDLLAAQVARLDTRVDHTDSRVESGLKDVQLRMDESFKAVTENFKAVEEREAARDKAAIERDNQRDAKFARRMTWTISIVGVGFTVFQFIFNLF